MNAASNKAAIPETDFYREAGHRHPLLSAKQERQTDLRKWAAARSCLRRVLSEPRGRDLVASFCKGCLNLPPEVERFEPRSLYFSLRKDIAPLLAKGEHAGAITKLHQCIATGTDTADLLRLVANMRWPATLMTGIAVVYMRRHGMTQSDLIADALATWIPALRTSYRPARRKSAASVHRALQHYLTARDKLVLHNLRLVHKMAWDHTGKGVAHSDLIQDGIIGLIRAAEKYEFRRGYRFTTYAYAWINQHLQRLTEGRGSLISYPAHVTQEINLMHRARLKHMERTGHDPGVDTLVRDTGFSADKVNQLRRLNNITISIDYPEADELELRLAANLADPDSERAVRHTEQRSLKQLLRQRMQSLEDREQAVLCGRWGLDGRPRRTFAQLADQLEVSREWVRQLEKSALQKLGREAELSEAYEELPV